MCRATLIWYLGLLMIVVAFAALLAKPLRETGGRDVLQYSAVSNHSREYEPWLSGAVNHDLSVKDDHEEQLDIREISPLPASCDDAQVS